MQEWLSFTDVELLIGEGCEADFFHDTRLGTALDRLDDLGTDLVMGRVVEVYLAREDRPTEYSAHLDTTSVSLYGQYTGRTGPRSPTASRRTPARRSDCRHGIPVPGGAPRRSNPGTTSMGGTTRSGR